MKNYFKKLTQQHGSISLHNLTLPSFSPLCTCSLQHKYTQGMIVEFLMCAQKLLGSDFSEEVLRQVKVMPKHIKKENVRMRNMRAVVRRGLDCLDWEGIENPKWDFLNVVTGWGQFLMLLLVVGSSDRLNIGFYTSTKFKYLDQISKTKMAKNWNFPFPSKIVLSLIFWDKLIKFGNNLVLSWDANENPR